MLMTGNARADGEPPAENILRSIQKAVSRHSQAWCYHLKNLDAKGNQATWSAEGDVSSSDDLYTQVGQLADYELLEQTSTKDKPVKFSAMLTSKGTPASGWSVNFYSFRRQPAIVGGWSTISKRIINIWSWIAKISIIALVSLNLRWIPRRTRFLRWKRKWKRLISKWWRRRKQRMHIGEKMQTVSKWPAKKPLKNSPTAWWV